MINEWVNTDQIAYQKYINCQKGLIISNFEDDTFKNGASIAMVSFLKDSFLKINAAIPHIVSIDKQPTLSYLGHLRRNKVNYAGAVVQELSTLDIPIIFLDFCDTHIDDWLNNENIEGHTLVFHSGQEIPKVSANNKVDWALCGVQNHIYNRRLHPENTYVLNLGEMAKNLSICEPSIRQADHLIFDASCLKYADAPSQKRKGVSGLSSENACQIMHYAGFNLGLKSLLISGFDFSQMDEASGDLYAQLIWYFLKARTTALETNTVNPKLIEFVIEADNDISKSLTFVQNMQNHTWWLKLDSKTTGVKMLPCGEEDFIAIKSDIITKRIFHYISNY